VQFPITIGLHRSRFLDSVLLIAAILASLAIFYFQCSPVIKVGLYIAIFILVIRAWRALRPTIENIRLERNGCISISRLGEHSCVQALPKAGATIHRWLTVIRLAERDGRFSTLIATFDSLNKSDFRRLRMFMRWQASFSELNDDA
jgi:hypothetical protein